MTENGTLALVLIKTELGEAKAVADALIEKGVVCWAMVVTGPYDVVAAVKVADNGALGAAVVGEIQKTEGIRNPTTLVAVYINKGVEPFP